MDEYEEYAEDKKFDPCDQIVSYEVYIESEDGNKELQIYLPDNKVFKDKSKAADFVSILIKNNIRFRLISTEGGEPWRKCKET